MPCFICRAAAATALRVAVALSSVTLAACASSDKRAEPGSAGDAVASAMSRAATMPPDSLAATHDSLVPKGRRAIAGTSGDADHDFLRLMSDHHKGLILLAHMTKERKNGGSAVADAKRLDTKQDAELDQLMNMLEKTYRDAYAPKVMPEHRAMADELKSRHGKEYERTFYQDIVRHHQEAIRMIDEYLPMAKNAVVRQMAEKMKADQAKEIRDFERKAP